MKHTLLFMLFITMNGLLFAQSATMVNDINSSGSLPPSKFFELNGKTFFFADGPYGVELYSTDGTTGGTTLVKDVNPSGDAYFYNYYFLKSAILNNNVYFLLDNGTLGYELWTSDGTSTGTVLVKNINAKPGQGQNTDNFFIKYNNKIYFPANDGISGVELWETDGTSEGTRMVKDINPTGNGIVYSDAIVYNNELYFEAGDNNSNSDLWKTDGTNNGTVLVKDLPNGSSSIGSFTIYNNTLFFIGSNTSYGSALWKTNGDAASTVLVAPGPCRIFTELAAGLVLAGNLGYDVELWVSDGSTSGTVLIKDISPTFGGMQYTIEFAVVNNTMFFTANDGVHGEELWKTDGTSGGTMMVKDINPTLHSNAHALTSFNNQLIFAADDGTGGQIWTSDGTSGGTNKALGANIPSCNFTHEFFNHNNSTLYFGAGDGLNFIELWKYESTPTSVLTSSNNSALYPAPNPTQDRSTITLNNPTLVNQVNVTNAQGVVVQNNEMNTNLTEIYIDLSNEKSGIYFIQIITGSGELMNSKVVKY